jgi:hypothetical protein
VMFGGGGERWWSFVFCSGGAVRGGRKRFGIGSDLVSRDFHRACTKRGIIIISFISYRYSSLEKPSTAIQVELEHLSFVSILTNEVLLTLWREASIERSVLELLVSRKI